ncbi:Eukaryotic elongation factor 2 kinase, partial [Ophiophagus hannah]
MADEDLIFHMEYLDNALLTKPGCGNCHEVDSDEEENYYICPITDDPVLNKAAGDKVHNYYSNLVKNESYSSSSSPRNSFNVREAWKHAIEKAKRMPDPWAEFHLEDIKMENATRYRKKLSNFLHMQNWKGAFNYVAKRYIETVDREVYFEDVDIVQTCIIEMKNRLGRPLYHLEHYIEGKYIKYNSNSGFVRDDNIRLTPQVGLSFLAIRQVMGDLKSLFGKVKVPVGLMRHLFPLQAFSHFTFERSGHQLIIVDIQGVGDLYTDPQIHTESGTDFGDGNLGVRGMALFFHSHSCNRICQSMGLMPFDLSSKEKDALFRSSKLLESAQTVVRGMEEKCGSSRARTVSGSRPPLLSRLSENSGDESMSDMAFDSLPSSPSSATPHSQKMEGLRDSGCPSEKRSDHEDMDHREKGHPNCNRRHESDEDSLGSSARVHKRKQDWKEALHWYDKALNMTDYDEGGEYDGTQDEPRYLLLAKEAEMLMTGGFNLDQDLQRSGDLYTEAAEDAMQAMKGRLANQYYQKAEEVWAMMEE